MKNNIIKLFFVLSVLIGYSQTVSLSSTNANISPSPLESFQAGGQGFASFIMEESDGVDVPALAFGSLPNVNIRIDFGDYIALLDANLALFEITNPDNGSDLSNLFNISNITSSVIQLAQNEVIPGGTKVLIRFPISVLQNSGLNEKYNGFNANIFRFNGSTTATGSASFFTHTRNTTTGVVDVINTFVDTAVSGNVLTNDSDFEGDTQTITTTSITTTEGVAVTIDANTGAYTYTPLQGFVGEDSFEYTVCDDVNPRACETVTVSIEVLPTGSSDNESPIANTDTNTTEADTVLTGTVLSNDYDPDGDPIVVTTTSVTTTEGVVVTIDPNTGEYSYTPPTGYVGEDSFEYTICDNANPQACDTATVIIDVVANTTNITVANDDAYYTTSDVINNTITASVLDNDTDPEGDTQTITTTTVTTSQGVSITIDASTGEFNYTPPSNFVGQDSFEYTVCDNGTPQACDTATVIIAVNRFLPPNYFVTVISSTTNIVGENENIDFVAFIGENNNQNSNGIDSVELRFLKSENYTIDWPASQSLTTLNGTVVSNNNWEYDATHPTLHRFTYKNTSTNDIFKGNSFSAVGIKAVFNSTNNTSGTVPLKVTVKGASGGQVNLSDDNDSEDFIYNN